MTICQAQSLELARQAADVGADALLAQGNEAGGHTGEMNLLPLLVDLVECYPHLPLLAAGAFGASLGIALLATPEAVEAPGAFKERIILSDGQDTAFTRLYDLLGACPWPEGIAGRVYRNRLVRSGTVATPRSSPIARIWPQTPPPALATTRRRHRST